MSTTYKIQAGDTFDSISRKVTGSESDAGRIAAANPGVFEPLTAGTTITVTTRPEAPKDKITNAPFDDIDEVSIMIDGERFRFWTEIEINTTIDSIDTVSFRAPFEPSSPEFREKFKPFSYKPVVVVVGGTPEFSGTMLPVVPDTAPEGRTIEVSAYSLPGVLNDCTAPASSFPLEFNDVGILSIARRLAAPFGIDVKSTISPVTIFERVALEPGKKIMGFLADLARQRNLIISNDNDGALVFLRSIDAGSPVARLIEDKSPVTKISPVFNTQEYYSDITGIEPAFIGSPGAQFTAKNPRLKGVLRPLTFAANDTNGGDLKEAVNAKLSRMFGNVVTYSVPVSTWRDPSGQLWRPNTTVTLTAPGAMIYEEYEFLIRSVNFTRDDKGFAATLDLVIPESFNGKTPVRLPWE